MIATESFTTRVLGEIGRTLLFSAKIAAHLLRHPPSYSTVLTQMMIVGVYSLTVLVPVSIFLGTNVALLGYSVFQPLGAESMLGMFVGLAGMRELAPIVSAILIAAKVGTEIASTLAVMRMDNQIDALEVMGVSPFRHLISPRLLAVGIMLPVLVVIANFLCLASGYAVSTYQLGLDSGNFLQHAFEHLSMLDVFVGVVKGSVFGVCICSISCYCGFYASGGPVGVGTAANRSVVISAMIVSIANYFISAVFYV